MQEILKYIRKADEDFLLIEDNDLIVVGVSGGKDSVILLYALSIYAKFKEKKFSVLGVHMDMGFDGSDIASIQTFCDKNSIPFVIEKVPIYEILKNYKKEDGSLDCSRCSNLKRGAIVSIAKKYKATKVAFGHHGDDAIETLFMNMIYSGKIDTFKPKIQYEDNDITFVRPMIYVKEAMLKKVMLNHKLPSCKSGCPNDGYTSRKDIKDLIQNIYKQYPMSKQNLLNILTYKNIIWNK